MIPNVEECSDVVVGCYYMVPTIRRSDKLEETPQHPRVVPVLGTLHEDVEVIGFKDRHWHPDRRFISQEWLDYAWNHWGNIFTPCPTHTYSPGRLRVPESDWPLWFDNGPRKMKCKRLVDSASFPVVTWHKQLETKYKDNRLRNMICPHRGISCVGVKAEADGGVVCPGHGLKWNPATGELMSRTGLDLRQPSFIGKPST